MKITRLLSLFLFYTVLSGCTSIPKNINPVRSFDENRYLGKWYEIARLDHSFERGLSHVTAEYHLRSDGGIGVTNRGFSITENKWKEASGKAYFVGKRNVGHLKVSFFGPFYSSYIIFDLDRDDYRYAYITGYNKSFLWFLSREPIVSHALKEQFIQKSKELGFKTDTLIFPAQH
ncbi:MAG: lipocalin family protein [Nitrosomonas sp.]|nr:lipocalin family protein [Nitrosomonas sp.]